MAQVLDPMALSSNAPDVSDILSGMGTGGVSAQQANATFAQKLPASEADFYNQGGLQNTVAQASQEVKAEQQKKEAKAKFAKILMMQEGGADAIRKEAEQKFSGIQMPEKSMYYDMKTGSFMPYQYAKDSWATIDKFQKLQLNKQKAQLDVQKQAEIEKKSAFDQSLKLRKAAVDERRAAVSDKLARIREFNANIYAKSQDFNLYGKMNQAIEAQQKALEKASEKLQGAMAMLEIASDPEAKDAAQKEIDKINKSIDEANAEADSLMDTANRLMEKHTANLPPAKPKVVAPAAEKNTLAAVAKPAPTPAPTQKGPPVGTVMGGYRFKGGNPNDQNNWEAVQ
jgi:hypothetical protein